MRSKDQQSCVCGPLFKYNPESQSCVPCGFNQIQNALDSTMQSCVCISGYFNNSGLSTDLKCVSCPANMTALDNNLNNNICVCMGSNQYYDKYTQSCKECWKYSSPDKLKSTCLCSFGLNLFVFASPNNCVECLTN